MSLPETAAAQILRAAAGRLRAMRRERDRHFPPELASGAAWNLLLELDDGSADAIESPLSPATRHRWLRALSAHGLVTFSDDQPANATLTPAGRARIDGYLSTCLEQGLL
jgi:hypothetical protein